MTLTESNILRIDKARDSEPPRGRRPWHVEHSYDMGTRETLPALHSGSMGDE